MSLKQLKLGKSPGPNGLSAAYYKTFTDVLNNMFLAAFNSLASKPNGLQGLLEEHISVIPKEGKDPSQVTNYRHISLLNVDLKLFSKILANHLSLQMTSLITMDQVGFIPGREARDSTLKALNLHHWMTKNKQKGFSLSLDVKKEFDRVAWDYMRAV